MGAASIAEAQPAGPLPDYHWCPGQFYDPGWGNNWDWNRCHDDFYFDGEPRDQGHWHGPGGWHPAAPAWDRPWPGRPRLPRRATRVAPAGMTTGKPVNR